MEIINIEKKAFETIIYRLENLSSKVQLLSSRLNKKELSEWYDNQDVCLALKISPRKLQTFRDNGTLPFVKINRKLFYKPDDVQKLIIKPDSDCEKINMKPNKF